jgi:hypothetical protein
MANQLGGNPIRVDTAATVISSLDGVLIQGLQWVDDDGAAGGAIANTEDLVMTIDGVTVQCSVAVVATQLAGAMAYNLILPAPIRVRSLIVSTIDGGTLLVWKA